MNPKISEVGTMEEKDQKDLEQINKSSEFTEEELEKTAMDYWLGGAWKDIIPQDKEKYAESTITDRDIMEHAVDLFIDALPNLNEINSLPKEAPDDDRGTKKDVFTSLKGKD